MTAEVHQALSFSLSLSGMRRNNPLKGCRSKISVNDRRRPLAV